MTTFEIKRHFYIAGLFMLSLLWYPVLLLFYLMIGYVIMLNSPDTRIWLIIFTIACSMLLVKPQLELIKIQGEILHFWFNQDDYI